LQQGLRRGEKPQPLSVTQSNLCHAEPDHR
jgi:hypothetical protein